MGRKTFGFSGEHKSGRTPGIIISYSYIQPDIQANCFGPNKPVSSIKKNNSKIEKNTFVHGFFSEFG